MIYEEITSGKTPEKQLAAIKGWGFKIVPHSKVSDPDYNDMVEQLARRKQKSRYDIDGLVIRTNTKSPVAKSGNPTHSIAFKQNVESDARTAVVLDIEWGVSKYNKLKPRVKIEPTKLGGTTVNYVTGHNAKYVFENKIGKGSKIKIIRSGDVIPYILEVISGTKPIMPSGNWEWDGVDIRLLDASSGATLAKIESFMICLLYTSDAADE